LRSDSCTSRGSDDSISNPEIDTGVCERVEDTEFPSNPRYSTSAKN
jgi:hypothetical protein